MAMLWMFDLGAVAKHNLYIDQRANTKTVWDVQLAIERFRAPVRKRPRMTIPH